MMETRLDVLRILKKYSDALPEPPSTAFFEALDRNLGVWTTHGGGNDSFVVFVSPEEVGRLNESNKYYVAVRNLIEDAVERTQYLDVLYGDIDQKVREKAGLPPVEPPPENTRRSGM